MAVLMYYRRWWSIKWQSAYSFNTMSTSAYSQKQIKFIWLKIIDLYSSVAKTSSVTPKFPSLIKSLLLAQEGREKNNLQLLLISTQIMAVFALLSVPSKSKIESVYLTT
ncbi:hypothetical protein IC582_015687 [Cucumis melo]